MRKLLLSVLSASIALPSPAVAQVARVALQARVTGTPAVSGSAPFALSVPMLSAPAVSGPGLVPLSAPLSALPAPLIQAAPLAVAAVPATLKPQASALGAALRSAPSMEDRPDETRSDETRKAAADATFDESVSKEGGSPETSGYEVQVSQPGRIGKVLRLLWPAHTLFRIKHDKAAIEAYLPASLKAFPQPAPSLLTRVKKGILFSRPVVALIRWQLANTFERADAANASELFARMIPEAKYNIVIEGGLINVMRIVVGSKVPDWILSKHVLMSGYSNDVRFAGEAWRGADGKIYLNDNSGTYQPSTLHLEQAAAYLRTVFPGIEFVAVVSAKPAPAAAPQTTAPAAPTLGPPAAEKPVRRPGLRGSIAWIYDGGSDIFKKEIRRKTIHQKNWGYLAAFLLMGHTTTAYAFAGFTVAVGVLEFLRMHWAPVRAWAQARFGHVMREKEAKQFTGFFYGALGVTVAVALYGWSIPLVAAGIMAYTVGDAVSPLVGMRFGWKPYTVNGTKRSLDGTLAGFAVVLAMILALGFPPLVALGAALAFSAVDTYPVKPDDNFWIPVVVPTALYLLGLL